MMKFNDEVFRHEILDTTFLSHMIKMKQNFDLCKGDVLPWTAGVFPADKVPDEAFNMNLMNVIEFQTLILLQSPVNIGYVCYKIINK